jgi:hypothetical protein
MWEEVGTGVLEQWAASTGNGPGIMQSVGFVNRWTESTVILHHTDCGMTDLAPCPQLLAEYFEISQRELAGKSVVDPVGSVRVDVEMILTLCRASPRHGLPRVVERQRQQLRRARRRA